MRRAQEGFSRSIAASGLELREKLALTCRALFDAGHDSGLAGQITARAEKTGTYYTQRLGLGFNEITAGNLLLVDEDLNVLGDKFKLVDPPVVSTRLKPSELSKREDDVLLRMTLASIVRCSVRHLASDCSSKSLASSAAK